MLQYNQITDLIAELLFKHDCVIVPNFGGFVARHHSSNFSKGNSILYPPSKHILFNKNLLHNDGLLISAVIQKTNFSNQEASKLIEDYVNYIQSLLSVKKRFELMNIGLLYFDNENSLRFEAKVDVNFLLESFGFEPIIANELIIETEKQSVVKHFEDRKITAEEIKQPKKSYAKIAALAIGLPVAFSFLILAAFSKPMKPILQSSFNPFYTPEKTYTPHNSKTTKAVFISSIKKPTLLADANGYANFKLAENGPVIIASFNDSVALTDKTIVVKPIHTKLNTTKNFSGKYQVVLGCFGIEENANKLVKELSEKQVNAGVSGTNSKGLHVVSCGGFDSKEEAANLLITIKDKFPNAWVLSK